MGRRWSFSCWMLLCYVGLFLLWFAAPSRALFLISGFAAVAGLAYGMYRENQNGYFADKVDFRLHALVVADLVLETISFEAFRLFEPFAVVETFHQNTNFFGCSLSFTVLIGAYRLFALRQKPASIDPVSASLPV